MNSFSFSSRGSSNMWWIVIGAVIALVVLIVLLLIFTGKSNALEGGLLECSSKGGECVASADECRDSYEGTVAGAFECNEATLGESQVCCFKRDNGER